MRKRYVLKVILGEKSVKDSSINNPVRKSPRRKAVNQQPLTQETRKVLVVEKTDKQL